MHVRNISLGLLFLLPCATLASAVQGPVPGPGAPPPPVPTGLTAKISVNSVIRPLSYSNTMIKPGNNHSGAVCASFDLTLDYTCPPGYSFLSCQWGSADPTGTMPSGDLYVFGAGNSRSETGWGFAPGKYTARCSVKFRHTEPNGQTTDHETSASRFVFAIGGEIITSVYDCEIPTFARELDNSNEPSYLQYFGHDPILLPSGAQRPQKGRVMFPAQQPRGSASPCVEASSSITILESSDSECLLAAQSESASGAIRPLIRFELTVQDQDGTVHHGSCFDCTSQTPWAKKGTFTAAKPSQIIASLKEQQAYSYQGFPYGWQRADELQLFDHLEKPMPGVYVQEVFAPETILPPGFWQSTPLLTWQTGKPDGMANAYDVFRFAFSEPRPKATAQPFEIHQRYFAGTRGKSWIGAYGGVNVGDFSIKYWSDAIDHIKH